MAMNKETFFEYMLLDTPFATSYWAYTEDLEFIEGEETSDMKIKRFAIREAGDFEPSGPVIEITEQTLEEGFDKAVEFFRKKGQERSNKYRWEDCVRYAGAKAMGDYDMATYDAEMIDIVVQLALFDEIRYA